ncbi:MAG: hypothetical protein RR923_02995 [Bacilli bacterium]
MGENSMGKDNSAWGMLIVLFLLFIVFGGALGGNGLNRGATVISNDGGGCNRVSNCEAQKQGMVDAYNTQLNTINQSILTRAEIAASTTAITNQAALINTANQSEKIFDLKMENSTLKNNALTLQMFNELNRRLDHMPIRPPYFAQGYVPDGQRIPQNCNSSCGVV